MKRAYWPRERLLEHQNKKLREIIKYAYDNVPFYHEKFKRAQLKPDDIKTVDDLSKLPIVRKDEIKQNLERMVSKEYDVSKLKMLRTSGSTCLLYTSDAADE